MIPWRREWLPTPVFLHGEFLGQKTWQATVHGVAKDSDVTERQPLSCFHGITQLAIFI